MNATAFQQNSDCQLAAGSQFLGLTLDGKSISDDERSKILQRVRAGEIIRLHMDIRAFAQTERPNLNFVRFLEAKLAAGAKSFPSRPFLRNHEQRDVMARGGTILASKLVAIEGGKAIDQTIEIVAPWAVEMSLLGLMDRFSIGWRPTGPILCTVCETSILRCSHWPGDTYDGKLCEVLFTDFVGVETSGVVVPAVADTGIQEIRAALSAARAAGGQSPPRMEKPKMSLTKIASLLGLADESDEATVLSATTKLQNEVESHRTLLAAEREARKESQRLLGEASTELAAIRQARNESDVNDIIQTATRSGRLVPRTVLGEDGKPRRVEGDIEAAIRLQARNHGAKAARDYAESLPVIVPVALSITDTTADKVKRRAISAPAGGSILKQLGVTLADVEKYGRLDHVPGSSED